MSRFGTRIKPSAGALYGIALALIFCIALFLRTYFPYEKVFTGDWVRFLENDPWYHMRLIENLVQHFPHRIDFDPYTAYPHGQSVFFAPLYDLILGFFIWVIGLGSPSKGVIETVGAYFPAILGALVTIPVYFIGKELFDRKAGLIAAALVMVLPGQFLLRSLLGYTDHHVAETLFSTLTMLFLILAVKSAKQKEVSFNSLLRRDWRVLRKPLIYSLLTGIALGFYLLSWVGGPLVLFIIFIYTGIQYIIDHLRGRTTDYLCIIGVPSFVIALLMVIPFLGQLETGQLQIASLAIAILAFLALSGLSLPMSRRGMRRVFYPLAVVVLAGIGVAALYLIDPSLLSSILDRLSVLRPTGSVQTIGEISPLSISIIWEEFTITFYLSLISLAVIAYFVIKEGAADKTLLLVWSVIMLVATFGQNRFAYYFAVNVAILTGYIAWKVLSLVLSIRKTTQASKEEGLSDSRKQKMGRIKAKAGKKVKRKKAKVERKELVPLVTRYTIARYAYSIVAIVAVFFLAFYPNIGRAIDVAKLKHLVYPRQDWYDALVWMRENTPEPFQDASFYYDLYQKPEGWTDHDQWESEDEGGYNYPESAYGVMSWWDYGHWITYMAHRIPNANPHQAGAWSAARFFTAQDESSANRVLNWQGSRYIIIYVMMALHAIDPDAGIYGHFYSMVDWAGEDLEEFFEVYYQLDGKELKPVLLYYPEYYQSMSTRLYIFGGKEWVPKNSTMVISYAEKTDMRGVRYKEISDRRDFATYEEAEAFLELHSSSNYRIVGDNQLLSPVPLKKLEHYSLIYKSSSVIAVRGQETISEVEIFEYTP